MMKKVIQFTLFLGLGVAVMTLVFRNQNNAFQAQCRLDGIPADQCSLIDKLWTDFSSVHIGYMLLVIAAFTFSNVCRALRWQMLLEPLGHRVRFYNSFLAILLGYFANLGFPRMGEVVRVGSLARYEKIPVERVMGTLVIDRLMDMLCLLTVIGLAFLLEGDALMAFITQNKSGDGASGGSLWRNPLVLSVSGLGIVGAGVAWLLRERLLQWALFKKIAGVLGGFRAGLQSVFRLRQVGLFLVYTVLIWLMFYLQCLLNLQAFPPTAHLGAGAALMIFVFGTLGFVIPSPGGMGTFHALCIAALALYGIAGSDGFSYANIAFFAIQIFYNLVAGVLSLILLPILNRRAASGATFS
jgi:glycosyltransferase 2 family protein